MSTHPHVAHSQGLAMMIVGLIGIAAAVVCLLVVTDPFPMWLVIAGGGLVFLGSGAAMRRTGR
ncbi:hypothetical protein OEB99_02965 [Actinotalea sp. M2MS4P-6]|uniref:hypothetical protein n=1 Tax=Actinotalea sp. M2MS4P-6 TaxID=2983762 RepID=UPI0021E49991|nr:hypothetical protein [Actinotalea sp. M2MS4P-6]MCV2393259.1 hypothetical protein [Actinotalea sp. M2MS4P-6]